MTQWHHERMNAYSEDLRRKIIEALRRGMGKSQAARTFSVSLSSVKRYAKMGSPQLLVKQSRAGAHTPPDRPKSRLRCLIPESQPLTKRSKSSTITSQRRGQCSKRTLITKS